MSKNFEIKFTEPDDYDEGTEAIIYHHGEEIARLWEHMEPEDARFSRDLSKFISWIKKAYELGYEDGLAEENKNILGNS